MIKIYTIGFTEKTAEQIFGLLTGRDITCITDTRVNNTGQLAGFAKARDLAWFAGTIGKISYQHHPDLAPSRELLARYRAKEITWPEYELEYLNLIDMRGVKEKFPVETLHQLPALRVNTTPGIAIGAFWQNTCRQAALT